MSTVSTYNILSFCINFQFCFLIFFILFSMSSFKSRIRRKSQSFPKLLKKNIPSELGVEISTFVLCERRWSWYRMTHCKVKDTGRGIVWHIAMWNTLVVLPYGALSYSTGRGTVWRLFILHWLCYCMTYCQVKGTGRGTVWHIAMWKALVMVSYDILPCEIHWLCYRMAHCHIALVVVPYGAFSYCTGCITVWHIARWKALVVVLYDTLPGERHWSWYCMTHCHVKGTSHGTVWHIARWEALTVVP
jgi:hypothetical protein